MSKTVPRSKAEAALRRLAAERILVLDGAMGTMIQALKLDEEGYRGARFDAWNREVRGNNDLLNLSRPDAVRAIHLAYFRAGADIVSTNTFSSTRIAQADYGMADIAYELNAEGARLAREAARARGRKRTAASVSSPARSVRPTAPPRSRRTSPIPASAPSPSTSCALAYAEQMRGLIDGGADVLLIETIFDTLNAKAAIYAIAEELEARGVDRAGDDFRHHHRSLRAACCPARRRKRSGIRSRTPRRCRLGLNCALGAKEMRAHIAELARVADTLICAYPNAGLPNEFGYYDESPEFMAELLGEFAEAGLVNIVGGCCGTTPEHIARHRPRGRRQGAARHSGIAPRLRLSGLEAFTLTPEIPFVNVGERTNVTGSAQFRKLVTAGDYAGRARGRARAGRERRADHRRQHGRRAARFGKGDGRPSSI